MANKKDQAFYIKEFASNECLCGKPKKRGFSFCYKCYMALPHDLKRGVYQQLGFGYEEAFDEACEYLQSEVW